MTTKKSLAGTFCAVVITTICLCGQSFGGILNQFTVYSTASGGGPAPHGLWTASDLYGTSGSGSNYYDITSMLFTQYDDGTASLIGTATNPLASVANVELYFGTFRGAILDDSTQTDIDNEYKQENGSGYSEVDHDFYATVSGTITFGAEVVAINNYVNNFSFQFGLGANAKSTTELGASAWIQDFDNGTNSSTGMESHHWDLNLRFEPVSFTGSVPEPASLMVWSVLMTAVVPFRRRRRRAA